MEKDILNKILIIEDDIQLTFFATTILERDGYQVKTFYNGKDGLDNIFEDNYSLILLDIDLPDIDGIQICKKIREVSDIPIIFFTAKNKVHEKVKGLDAGANDYITKPVEVPELLARVRAHLRNKNCIKDTFSDSNREKENIINNSIECKYTFNTLVLNPINRIVSRDETNIHLSPKEFDILYYFMKNPNKLITKQQIFEKVWDAQFDNFSDKKVIDEHLNKLRKKVHLDNMPKLIHTIYGVGYILR
ncbi:MAG: response regulator transcription factor [Cyanobacteriota bacterium]